MDTFTPKYFGTGRGIYMPLSQSQNLYLGLGQRNSALSQNLSQNDKRGFAYFCSVFCGW